MAANPYDQFDVAPNPYDQFDTAASPDTSQSTPLSWLKGAGQSALAIGSGALKGVNSAVNDLLPGDSKGLQQQIDTDPVMNYRPSSPEAQSILGGIANVASPITNTLSAAKKDIGDAFGQRTADVTGDVATLLGARGAASGLGGKAATAAKASTLAPEAQAALAAGLKLTPEQVGAPVGNVVQSLTGAAKLERTVSKSNATQVTNLAKDDLGIPRSTTLNDSVLTNLKIPENAVYDQVSKLGQVRADPTYAADISKVTSPGANSFAFDVPPAIEKLKAGYGNVQSFDAGDAVAKVRQLRADASKNIKAPNVPEQNALGYAQKQIAEAIESQLDRHVQTLSAAGRTDPGLIDQLRAARVQLAKIHSVQDALDGGNVSATELGKQLDRGVPLSGNLRTVAQAANNYGRSFQDISKIRDGGPFGVLDLGFGVGAGLAHPAAAAAVLARPLARAALASGPYQRSLTSPGIPSGLLSAAKPASLYLTSQQQQQGLLQ